MKTDDQVGVLSAYLKWGGDTKSAAAVVGEGDKPCYGLLLKEHLCLTKRQNTDTQKPWITWESSKKKKHLGARWIPHPCLIEIRQLLDTLEVRFDNLYLRIMGICVTRTLHVGKCVLDKLPIKSSGVTFPQGIRQTCWHLPSNGRPGPSKPLV